MRQEAIQLARNSLGCAPNITRAVLETYAENAADGVMSPDTMREVRVRLTGGPDDIRPVQFNPLICGDFVVVDRSFSIEMPNRPNTFWEPQRLAQLTLAPGVQINVQSRDVYGRVMVDWAPIQNWARPAVLPIGSGACRACWVIRFCDFLQAQFRLSRTLDTTESPMDLSLTLDGFRLVRNLDTYDTNASIAWLRERGITDAMLLGLAKGDVSLKALVG